MHRPAGFLRRMAGRSPGELALRATQQAFIVRERAALALQRIAPDRNTADTRPLRGWQGPAGTGPLEHFRNRPSRFFAGLDDRDRAVDELRRRWPDAEAATIAAAERILRGSFDLLGYTDLHFGSPPDWHLDPLRQVRAPARPHWSRIDYLDPAVAGDHKVVWELNRQQYLGTLGQAYWYTNDERYAAAFVGHLTSWMERNPPSRGVNWASSLEVSFRAISWLWGLHFFRHSPALTEPFFARVLHTLEAHAHHIERYLSTYFSPNTHLTGEALGLFHLGVVLPEFRQAKRWWRTGLAVFAAEVPRQVLPDGVYFEQSTWYHRYTIDFLIHLVVLAETNGIDLDAQHTDALERMLHHVLALTRPDGTVPLVGDDDGGCLMPLDGPPSDDFRAALATGAALFGRGDFKHVAGTAARQTYWLLGTRGMQRLDDLAATAPDAASAAFDSSGFHVMRDGWDADANYLLVDAGPHGSLNGGHAHADALAIVVACGTDNVLVDSGTGTYTTDPAGRDHFRATPAHNTLTVDGRSSSVPGGPFRWDMTASTVVDRWISTERFDFFRGRHDGFARLHPGMQHERSILFLKRDYWIMRDRITGAGPHSVESRFHFAPHLSVEPADGTTVRAAVGRTAVMTLHVHGASRSPDLQECVISDLYGSFRPALRAVHTADGPDDADLITFMIPRPVAAALPVVRQLEAGMLVLLAHGPYLDRVVVGATTTATADGITTDAEWAWVRSCAESGRTLDYILIDGSALYIDGEQVVQRAARASYLRMDEGGDR